MSLSAASRDTAVDATDLALVVVVKGTASSALPVTPAIATTSTITRVATNVANVTLLASNTARRGATITNNSPAGAVLYVKLGTTANIGVGTESYTVPLVAGAYYEVPYAYSGRIDGIWSGADAVGFAMVDEITP